MTVFFCLLVVTSMLGVGAFSLAPALAQAIPDPSWQQLFWAASLLYVALGVASYRLLMLRFQVAGGEFGMLSRYSNARLGQLAGLCSVLAGFAVPAALSCQILAGRIMAWLDWPLSSRTWVAVGVLAALSLLSRQVRTARHLCIGFGALVLVVLLPLLVVAASGWLVTSAPIVVPTLRHSDPSELLRLPLYLAFAFSGFNALIYLPAIDRVAVGRRIVAMRWGVGIGAALIMLANACALRLAPESLGQGMDAIMALSGLSPELEPVTQMLWMSCLLGTVMVSLLLGPGILGVMGVAGPGRKRHLPVFVVITAVMIVVPLPELILAAGGFFLMLCMSLCVALTLRYPVADGPYFRRLWENFAPRGFLGANVLILLAVCWQEPYVLILPLTACVYALQPAPLLGSEALGDTTGP